MNILMAGLNEPFGKSPTGGTQSWMKTVANYIGERVDFWEPGYKLTKTYDLGIIAHAASARVIPALSYCKKVIQVTHGIVKEEKPNEKVDLILATSEEVRDHWNLDCPIIRQPIDTHFWSVSKRSPDCLSRFAYRRGETHSQRVSELFNLEYQRISGMTPKEVREALKKTAVCHATGRAALEAMACGIPTLIYDHRAQYQGHLLDRRTLAESAATNYSGRGGIDHPTVDQVGEATEYVMNLEDFWRDYILTNHDASKIAKELLCYSF